MYFTNLDFFIVLLKIIGYFSPSINFDELVHDLIKLAHI